MDVQASLACILSVLYCNWISTCLQMYSLLITNMPLYGAAGYLLVCTLWYFNKTLTIWVNREKSKLKRFGHLMRLDENTPARKALRVALIESKRTGGPKLTWIEMNRKQLQAINLTWEETSHLTKARKKMEGYFERTEGRDDGTVGSDAGDFWLLNNVVRKNFFFIFLPFGNIIFILLRLSWWHQHCCSTRCKS